MNYAETHITKNHEEKVAELKVKAKKIGGQLLSWSTRIGIKVAILGVIKNTDVKEFVEIKEDMAKSVSNLIGNFVEERINSHTKDIELIQSFRELLSNLPSKLQENGDKPLVIIIDELDRCKPTFAVEIIEKIKHLFSVKNVVFVLVMNKAQLEESIKSVYGQNIDAHTYLQKFINLETKIPKRTNERYTNDLSKYSKKLLQLHDLQTWGDNSDIIACIEPLANHFNLSLRQLEKVYTNLAVFYGSSTKSQSRYVAIIVFLAVVKVLDPWLFDQLLLQKICFSKVTEKLNLSNLNEENGTDKKLYRLMDWTRYALLSSRSCKTLGDPINVRIHADYQTLKSLGNYNIGIKT